MNLDSVDTQICIFQSYLHVTLISQCLISSWNLVLSSQNSRVEEFPIPEHFWLAATPGLWR